MPDNKLVEVGDIHLKFRFPMFHAKRDFLNWLADLEHLNNPNNTLLLTGDVGDYPKMQGVVVGLFYSWLVEQCRFKEVIIVTGNHDKRRGEGNFLDSFKSISFVTIVEELTARNIDGLKVLLMPHYLVQKKGDRVMREYYGNLSKYRPDIVSEEYDLVCGHFPDETQASGIDISDVKGKRLHGDIHLASENYIGTPVINRADEAGKDCQIAVIDCKTKEFSYVDVPQFLDFYAISYDEPLPTMDAKYKMISIEGAPSEQSAKELVSKIENGHLHSFTTIAEKDCITDSDLHVFKSDKHEFLRKAFLDYISEHKISKLAIEKMRSVFFKKSEEKCDTTLETQKQEKL